ncbi:hypothetical protein EYZ11_010666 [Aspergillus tanneri]|uniref:Uncharacterized protein n=1 Tax=Aspergillus tanneri TaxID=1220188 RepID=A0A4S3J6X6_9EURO|nr:uncharacterized protein ATNIH1004_009212 [Aspergillus tanneri]KAA8645001.1 hypothetical protein ATNIH1004_009212 [Aspergillus tanneri]THC89878.1 hypothetical protein EYZ11_010666 [Aspergillus tanneri]
MAFHGFSDNISLSLPLFDPGKKSNQQQQAQRLPSIRTLLQGTDNLPNYCFTSGIEKNLSSADVAPAGERVASSYHIAEGATDTIPFVSSRTPNSASTSQPESEHPKPSLENTHSLRASCLDRMRQRWSSQAIGTTVLDLTHIWQGVAQAYLDNTPIGLERADWLMQLAFNIASPEVYVGLKRLLTHLRDPLHALTSPFPRNAAGVYQAGQLHLARKGSSQPGLALSYYFFYHLLQELREQGWPNPVDHIINEINGQIPNNLSSHEVKKTIQIWQRRAWWCWKLIHPVNDPNIVCFLPQGSNHFGHGEKTIYFNHYPHLKKAEYEVIQQILRQIRPTIMHNVPRDFYEIFLYHQAPRWKFQLEDWSDEEIRAQPLDSMKFADAFRVVEV